MSTLTSLRLFTRAPWTRIRWWLSASCCSRGCGSVVAATSAQLLDADEVAGGIAEGAVADAVGLLGRLLDDLGVAGLQPLERAVEVGGGQVDAGEGALGHHLGDRAPLVLGDAGGGGRRVQDDRRVGVGGGGGGGPVD